MSTNQAPNPSLPVSYEALDVAVVGAGPVGSFAALNLARTGAKTAVFEEHPTIGAPSHCAGHLSIRSLAQLGLYPLPSGLVENIFSRARFFSHNGLEFSVKLRQPVTCAVNRQAFDEYLAKKALAAGADYHLNSRVQSLIMENGFVKGVNVQSAKGEKEIFPAKIVIDAEGISSRILNQAGLQKAVHKKLVYAVEAEVENVNDVDTDAVEVFFGSDYAPGFYAWLIPKLDGSAKLGLATKTGNPQEYLNRLMTKHPVASRQLKKAHMIRRSFHAISLGGPIPRVYSNGFLVVGDAASQVKPTTGGGVVFGLTAARIAAQVADQAIRTGDYSTNSLKSYQKVCQRTFGFDAMIMTRARAFIDEVSDRKIENTFKFSSMIGLARGLEDIDEIDFQGQTLLKTLHRPAVLSTLIYLLGLYLSANLSIS